MNRRLILLVIATLCVAASARAQTHILQTQPGEFFRDDFQEAALDKAWQAENVELVDGKAVIKGSLSYKLPSAHRRWRVTFAADYHSETVSDWQSCKVEDKSGQFVSFYQQGKQRILLTTIEGKQYLDQVSVEPGLHTYELQRIDDKVIVSMDDGAPGKVPCTLDPDTQVLTFLASDATNPLVVDWVLLDLPTLRWPKGIEPGPSNLFCCFEDSSSPICRRWKNDALINADTLFTLGRRGYSTCIVDRKQSPELFELYGVKTVPAVVILDSGGKIVAGAEGTPTADELINFLERLP